MENRLPLQKKSKNMIESNETIKKLIAEGHISEAINLAENCMGQGNDAMLHYLMGNAYMKQGNRKAAMNAYRLSEQLDPESPAAETRKMIDNIMAFYNKDLYNP